MALMSNHASKNRRATARRRVVDAIVDMQLGRLCAWPLTVFVVLLIGTACGSDPTLSTQGRDTKPVEDGPGRVTTERQRVANASVPLPSPVTAASLHAYVNERALRSARLPYAPDERTVPEALTRLDYAQYRSIEFRPQAAVWRGESPFELQLFHPGSLYQDRVRIHVVEGGHARELLLDRELFRYPEMLAATELSPELSYAGFRVHYPFGRSGQSQEAAVFLGASYFRLLGGRQAHGLSGRGLAVDVVPPGNEEFPVFREFWLLQPAPADATLVFFALLDSPSVTGAYRFDLRPGDSTMLQVDARLHARRDIAKLGVAPLTSMFLYGPNRAREWDDYRPQVHDSDGLLMLTRAGEWILRPLSNRRRLRVTSLRDRDPQGFGLVQRDRRFDSYLDLEADYHRRPSVWIEVEGDAWGGGGVELVEIPTRAEFNDNIVAYWAPDEPFGAGQTRSYRYRATTFDRRLPAQGLMQVERTRIGWDALPGESDPPPRSQRRFMVDFVDAPVPTIQDGAWVAAVLQASNGQTSNLSVQPLPDAAGWRASFDLQPQGDQPSDMRLFLTVDGTRLTETWTYVWYPDRSQ